MAPPNDLGIHLQDLDVLYTHDVSVDLVHHVLQLGKLCGVRMLVNPQGGCLLGWMDGNHL
jgi:hypothetical protein